MAPLSEEIAFERSASLAMYSAFSFEQRTSVSSNSTFDRSSVLCSFVCSVCSLLEIARGDGENGAVSVILWEVKSNDCYVLDCYESSSLFSFV